MKSTQSELVLHVMGCLIFLSLPWGFSPGPTFTFDGFINSYTLRECLSYLLLIFFFYSNLYALLPNYFFKQRYTYFGIITISFLLIITFLPLIFFSDDPFRPELPPEFRNNRFLFEISHNLSLFLLAEFLSLSIIITKRWKQSEREKLSAELSYLKAQINPHFLFNTLNSIYSLAIEKSDKTAETVVKLSAMMRYVITDASAQYVSLEKELHYIQSYIELQQLRFGSSVPVLFTVNGNGIGMKIAPLVLIPFVENAFKHGVNAEENSEIKILIYYTESELKMEVTNNKVKTNLREEEKSGLGINNTKNRLMLLYPNKHELLIQENDIDFKVTLVVLLT